MVVSVFPLARADTIDSYDSSNQSSDDNYPNAIDAVQGQCFKPSSDGTLLSAILMLKNPNSAGGTWRYIIQATSGTYGTTCGGTSSILAVSESFTGVTIGASYSLVTKSFTGANQIVLTSGTAYGIALQQTDFAPSANGFALVMGRDDTSPTHAGNRYSCISPSCGGSGDSLIDEIFTVSGTLTTSGGIQIVCYGSCGSTVNTNSTSGINFNVSQTIFYKQQISQDGFAINMSTVIGKSYAISFGLTLFLGLYATDLTCPQLSSAFTPSCPAFLLRSEAFPNPQKGTSTMFLNNQLKAGQIIGIAFSANRNGLVLNDTAINTASFKTSGIMPSVITQFEDNGNLKTNLKLNIEVAVLTPTLGITTPSIGEMLLGLIDNFGAGRVAGGLFWFFAFSIGIIIGLIAFAGKYEQDIPIGMISPFIFLGTSLMFSSLGALPAYVPILIFVVVAWMFSKVITER